MSFALIRKQPDLVSVVVDVEKVCQVGRAIASEHNFAKRITYLAGDFLQDDLPTGFDLALLCDVGSFSEIFFRRIYGVLNSKGYLVLVDKFAPRRTNTPPSRQSSALPNSMEYPETPIEFTTTEMAQAQL